MTEQRSVSKEDKHNFTKAETTWVRWSFSFSPGNYFHLCFCFVYDDSQAHLRSFDRWLTEVRLRELEEEFVKCEPKIKYWNKVRDAIRLRFANFNKRTSRIWEKWRNPEKNTSFEEDGFCQNWSWSSHLVILRLDRRRWVIELISPSMAFLDKKSWLNKTRRLSKHLEKLLPLNSK